MNIIRINESFITENGDLLTIDDMLFLLSQTGTNLNVKSIDELPSGININKRGERRRFVAQFWEKI